VIAGVLFIAVHFAGIALLRYVIEDQLHPALLKGTSIERVELGLFSGLVELSGFELKNDGEVRITAGTAIVDVRTSALLLGAVRVDRAELRDVYLRVDRLDDGSLNLGLPKFTQIGDGREAEAAEPFDFSLTRARLERVRIDYRDGENRSDLVIDSLSVGAYSLIGRDQTVPVSWKMLWDGHAIAGEAALAMDADTLLSASGKLRTDLIDLSRVERLARLDQPILGEVGFDGTFAWQAERAMLSGALRAPTLAYSLAERRVELTGMVIPSFQLDATFEPDLAVIFTPGEAARIDAWDSELDGQAVSGNGLTLLGVLTYQGTGTVDVRDADYRLRTLSWQQDGRVLAIDGLRLTGTVQQSIRGDTPFPALNVLLSIDSIAFDDPSAALAIRLSGVELKDLALSPLDGRGTRGLAGRLAVAASNITQADTALSWQAVDASLGGEVGREALSITSDLTVSALGIAHPQLGEQPLKLARVAAKGLTHADATRFDSLQVDGLDLPSQPVETGLKVKTITLNKGSFSAGDGAALDEIIIDGLQTAVIRDRSGQWRYATSRPAAAGAAQTPPPTGQSEAVAAADREAPLAWRVGAIRVTGESVLGVADLLNPDSTAPRFRIEKFDIGEIASSAPDADTPFDIVLRPDEYAEFVFKGQARPLADLYLKAEGHLHGFAMQAFNGVIADDLGHRFTSGQLDNDFTISIDGGKLDMSNALSLATVEAEEIPDKEGPPLTMAVALLEDRDGNIKLEVPVAGDLSDPNFRVLGALNPIIMKAVAGTAALAIQPLGSVLLVGGLVADQALKVTFESVAFEPASTKLDEAAEKYLNALATKLKEKPKLGLRFCGVAVESERKRDKKGEYVDKEGDVLAVADQRAEAVKAYLAGKGLGKKQLRRCRPVFDGKAEAVPRVDIRF
jgi:hypothetical protein